MAEALTERDREGADPVADLATAVMNRAPTTPDAAQALRILRLSALRISPGLTDDEAQDLVHEAVARLAGRANKGLRLEGRSAHAAYLYTTLRRVIAEYRRLPRHRREVTVDQFTAEAELVDDAAAARLHRAATADSVRSALVRARSRGDGTAFQVGTYILDKIQETGSYPNSRETGDALGISHTAVAKALERLRGYFDPDES